MDPIKSRGYAQAQGFNPGTAPNTAEQQRRQDEEFIRQFREVNRLELDQKATALADLKERNALERQNINQFNQRSEEYAAQQDKLELQRLQREYQAQQSVTGMTSKDKKFNETIELITGLSNTAADLAGVAGELMKEEAEERVAKDFAEDKQKAVEAQTTALGDTAKGDAVLGTAAVQQSDATQIERIGGTTTSWDTAARMKDWNPFYRELYQKTYAGHLAKDIGEKMLLKFQDEQINNPDKTYILNGEEQKIGQIDISKSENFNKLAYSQLGEVLKEAGLEDRSTAGLGNFFSNSQKSIDQVTGTIRTAEIAEQKADRIDKAKAIFNMDPTPINSKMLYTTLTQSGLSNKQARVQVADAWVALPDDEFYAQGDAPFGPNGIAFKDQYPGEWQAITTKRESYIEANRRSRGFQMESVEEEARLELKQTVIQDYKDGSFDANPETLEQAAQNAEIKQQPKLASDLRALIPLTKSRQYDSSVLKNLEADLAIGITNYTVDQIAANPSLSAGAKQKAIQMIEQAEAVAVPQDIATADKAIVNGAIRNRAKVNTFQGAPDESVKVMEKKAWMRYRSVFADSIKQSQSPEAASTAALQDFYAQFGTDETKGEYAVNPPLANETSGSYINGTIAGKAFEPDKAQQQIAYNVHTKGAARAFAEPELYTGETKELEEMLGGVKTGKIKVPSAFTGILQRSGGNMSMRQLLNQRLKANDLPEIPKDVGKLADEVERSFDPSYTKFINYQPNPTRTDIAVIGSGYDPIYHQNIPANIKDDVEFQEAVTGVAQRLGISEGDLYAVMDFETGGSFAPNQRNAAGSGATGLIQFMPSTAQGLGTSTDALSSMTRVQQMQYVEKYLTNAGVKPGMNAADLYMAVLFPAAVGKSDDFVLFGNGAMSGYTGRAYDQNAGLDKNGDGSVTKAEAASSVLKNPWRQRRNMRPELLGVQ